MKSLFGLSQMFRYANVDGTKQLPFSRGRGKCPYCGGMVIAKCGSINTHHWAHEAKKDCDGWSEPIGPWHLSWQNLVRPEFVEVPFDRHRADICANSNIVLELQHSPIQPEEIAERENFYGDMVWLFDATYRFDHVVSENRVFFSFGPSKHITFCQKPVFLDFGDVLVQVERMSDLLANCSGFGRKRDRQWFVSRFLSRCLREKVSCAVPITRGNLTSRPWFARRPFHLTKHPTHWIDQTTGQTVTYPKNTVFIWFNQAWVNSENGRTPGWVELLGRHPELANGWRKDDLLAMKAFLCATPMILGGKLRLMPSPVERIQVNQTVQPISELLSIAEKHIRAGRIPVLKDSTKRLLLDRARQYETSVSGKVISPM
jgi:hypothetical protein